jgi:hypothetical protein
MLLPFLSVAPHESCTRNALLGPRPNNTECFSTTFKVDLYSGCDSDATSNTIVTMEKRYYCEIIAFLSRRYYRF